MVTNLHYASENITNADTFSESQSCRELAYKVIATTALIALLWILIIVCKF